MPVRVTSDKSHITGEKPRLKFILTMPDKKKQKLYLANYVSPGNSAKRFDAVVEATGETNIGKSFRIV